MSTRNIVPRNDEEGSLGTTLKRWLSGFFKWINIDNYIQFNPNGKPAYEEGRLFYDSADKSLSFYIDHPDITHNLGREFFARVFNGTGSAILDGKVVRLADVGDPTSIVLAKADSEPNARGTLGMVTADISNLSTGYVTIIGEVHNIDTSIYDLGDRLYLSDTIAGELTKIKPAIPVFIGYVASKHATEGIIFVKTSESFAGIGDMLKGTYDTDDNGIVDKSEALNDGSSGGGNNVSASEARTHIDDTDNPHGVDKSDVGLGNVPNLDTTDAVNKTHDQNSDTKLDDSQPNEVTSADLRSHLDDTDNPHGVIANEISTDQSGITVQNHIDDTDNPHNTSLSNLSSKDHSDLTNKNNETDIKHITDDQKDAFENANNPSSGNPIITQDDYDGDGDGIVDQAEALNDGSSGGGNNVTASEARNHIDDIANPHNVTPEQVNVFYYAEDDTETLTTSTTYIEKLKLTFTPTEQADFLISYTYELANSSGGKSTEARIEVDDTTEIGFSYVTPDDTSAYRPQTGFKKINLTAVEHTIDIDFRRITTGDAEIRRARIIAQKIT